MSPLSTLTLVLGLFALFVAAEVWTTTPPNGTSDDDLSPYCTLFSLSFDGGFALAPAPFQKNQFTYQCSCAFPAPEEEYLVHAFPVLSDPYSSAELTHYSTSHPEGLKLHSKANGDAISNTGKVDKSPFEAQSRAISIEQGPNTIVIGVSCNGMGLPHPCYYEYTITCDRPAGSITGDPQFIGLRGQQYQVHGVSGEIYNIVSDASLQYNARFVFLDQGECPTVDGRKQKGGCFSHPGSYLGEIGIKTRAGDRIRLVSGPAALGFASLSVNGQELATGDSVLLAGDLGAVSRNNTHTADISVGQWNIVFSNSDHYVNQLVRVSDARALRSHGLLGQTWREATYQNAIKHVQGQVDDYVIREGEVFGDNFMFNMFN